MIGAIFLLMAGVTVPAVGPRIRQRRQHRALHQLWRDLTEFAPAVRFTTPMSADVGPFDITDRLRNRITEIHDVLAGPLQPYLDPAVQERATKLALEKDIPEDQVRAVAEAAVIAAALLAAADDHPVLAEEPVVFAGPATTDYRDEAAWLTHIGKAYATSPIVTIIRQEARNATDTVI
jgi:hypothetical protein